MALSKTTRGTGTNTAGTSSFTATPASNFGAGMAVLAVSSDNNGVNGAAFASFSVSDTNGNT